MKPRKIPGLGACIGALALLATPAGADVADIQWSGSGTAAREFQVAPAKFAEWCGKLRKGEKVAWRFEAASPVDFNIHYHEAKDIRFPARQDAVAKADGSLEVPLDHDYCWMWTNKSAAPVELRATLTKAR